MEAADNDATNLELASEEPPKEVIQLEEIEVQPEESKTEKDPMVTDSNDRKGFVRKVYSLLAVQLGVTAVGVATTSLVEEARAGLLETAFLCYPCMALSLGLVIGIYCWQGLARRVPYNYVASLAFTLLQTYIVAYFSAFYAPVTVCAAALLTIGVTGGLTVYACAARTDFTICHSLSFVLIAALLVFTGLTIWIGSLVVTFVYCLFGALVFGVMLVVDTQLIIGGKFEALTYDDYILAALLLYVDVISMFVYVLKLIGTKLFS